MDPQYSLPNVQAGSVHASLNGSPVQFPGQPMQIGQPMVPGQALSMMQPGQMMPGAPIPGMPIQQQFGAFPTDMNAAAAQIQQQQMAVQMQQGGKGAIVSRNYIRVEEWDKSRLASPTRVTPTQKSAIDDKGQEQKYYVIPVPYNYGSNVPGAERYDTLKFERRSMKTGPIQRNSKSVKFPKYQVKEQFNPASDPQQAILEQIFNDLKEWAIDVITHHRDTIGSVVTNYKTFGRINPNDRRAQGTALMKDVWFQKNDNSPRSIFYEVKYFESRDKVTQALTSITHAEWKLPCPKGYTVQGFQQIAAMKLKLKPSDFKIINNNSLAIPWELLMKTGIQSSPIVEFNDLFVGGLTAKFRPRISTAIFESTFHVGDDQTMTEEEMLSENPEYSMQALDKFVDMLGTASSAPSNDASAFDLNHNPAAQVGTMLPPSQNGAILPPGGAIPLGGSSDADQAASVAQMITQMGLTG